MANNVNYEMNKIVCEQLNLIKKIFHTKDEQPNINSLICVHYNHEYFFDMYKPVDDNYVYHNANNFLLWKDIDYWCYMSDIEKFLTFAYNQEHKED